MAVLYTPRDIQTSLQKLRIKPEDGMVTGGEAARILTWRAKTEQGIEHDYRASAIRRHVVQKNLKAYPRTRRFNLYKVEDIFEVPLVPNRGLKQRKQGASHGG